MFILASPDSSSRAASDTFRSVFQDEISRWQTKYVALTNNAWAQSAPLRMDEEIRWSASDQVGCEE